MSSVAKNVELSVRSPEGFEHAVRTGLERASKTLEEIQGAWIKEQKVILEGGKMLFQVDMKITFVVRD